MKCAFRLLSTAALALCLLAPLATNTALAGAVPVPKAGHTRVHAYTTDIYHISFRAHEEAQVAISGDGDTELDLYVYDENGHLIASDDEGSEDDRSVSWTPRWTGRFTIKVVNRGSVYNAYGIATN